MSGPKRVTLGELNAARGALTAMAEQYAFEPEVAAKVAAMYRWASGHWEDYDKVRRMIVARHAKRDDDGNILPQTRVETGPGGERREVHVPNSFQADDVQAFLAEEAKLNAVERWTNGRVFTAEDFAAVRAGEVIAPSIMRDLGPLYDWGDADPRERSHAADLAEMLGLSSEPGPEHVPETAEV